MVVFLGWLWNSAEVENKGLRSDPYALLLLGLALCLGCLRFWRLDEWSLWFDEALTWTDAQNLGSGSIHNTLGYRWIAGLVHALGGEPTEARLRILPAIAGWLVIPACAWAFTPLAGPRRASAAAVLVAVSTWHIYWSQNARFYTFAQLFSLIGVACCWQGLAARSYLRLAVGVACTAFAGLFHPSAALFLPALVLAPWLLAPLRLEALQSWKRPSLVLALSALGVGLLAAPWIYDAWTNYALTRAAFYPVHLALTTGFYVTPALATAALIGVGVAALRREVSGLFIASLVLCVLGLSFVLSTQVRVSAQYVFVLLPWIALLGVWSLDAWPKLSARAALGLASAGLALLALPSMANSLLYFTVRNGERPHWREAFAHVWDKRGPEDLILAMEGPVAQFYLDPLAVELRDTTRVRVLSRFNPPEVEEWAKSGRPLWIVFNRGQLDEWDAAQRSQFERFLANECRHERSWPLMVESRDLSVEVYRR